MNKKNLSLVFEQYIENFNYIIEPETQNETYKWKAVQTFKDNWNIDDADFAGMYKLAFSETSSLLDNKTVMPSAGIQMLLTHENEIEFVRECFRELFVEDNGDFDLRQARLEKFIQKINSKISIYANGSWKYLQTMSSAIYYLNLNDPDNNFFYKPTEAKEWANCIEFAEDFGSGENFSLKKYYKMCRELLEEIKKNEELMKVHMSRFEKVESHYKIEDKFKELDNILVYDIIYCAHTYNFYSKAVIATTSVKERIRRAELNQKCEAIALKISEAEARCVEILAESSDDIDLTGKVVRHKMFKEGEVVSQTAGKIEVSFASGIKKLQFPEAFANGFLKSDDENIMAFVSRKGELNSEYQKLQKVIEELNRELEKTKKELN